MVEISRLKSVHGRNFKVENKISSFDAIYRIICRIKMSIPIYIQIKFLQHLHIVYMYSEILCMIQNSKVEINFIYSVYLLRNSGYIIAHIASIYCENIILYIASTYCEILDTACIESCLIQSHVSYRVMSHIEPCLIQSHVSHILDTAYTQ